MEKEKLDTIGRDDSIDKIFKIIENVAAQKGNLSFALDGFWGSGKTFVIEKLENKLEQIQSEQTTNNKYFIIHYNCWQYEYYEEPLIAIVSAILDTLDGAKLIKDEKQRLIIKEVFKKLGMSLLFLSNAAVKRVSGIDVKNTISKAIEESKKIKTNAETEYKNKHKYDEYFDFKKILMELRKALEQLSNEYSLVFVVDELDRCLPEYSIKILERLHHLTEDIDNTITIIATDKSKLEKTINTIYGIDNGETDYCSKYLKKFIKLFVKLDLGKSKENVKDKYSEYFNLFSQDLFKLNPISFIDFFNILFDRIDVREQEIIMNKILLIHKLTTKEKSDISLMYLEMLIFIIENYYDCKLSDFFNGKSFQSHYKSGSQKKIDSIIQLNDIFTINSGYYYDGIDRQIIDVKHGISGFILYLLSYIKENGNVKNMKYVLNNSYFMQTKTEDLLGKISKFRELMVILK